MKFLIPLALLTLLGSLSMVNALQCFVTSSTDPNYKPLFKDYQDCGTYKQNPIKQCYKQIAHSNSTDGKTRKGVYYGCDYKFCSGITNGKCQSSSGVNTCCCGGDLCNSAGFTSFFPVITVIAAVKMLF